MSEGSARWPGGAAAAPGTQPAPPRASTPGHADAGMTSDSAWSATVGGVARTKDG